MSEHTADNDAPDLVEATGYRDTVTGRLVDEQAAENDTHRCSPNRCCNECGRHLTPHVMAFRGDMSPIYCVISPASGDTTGGAR